MCAVILCFVLLERNGGGGGKRSVLYIFGHSNAVSRSDVREMWLMLL